MKYSKYIFLFLLPFFTGTHNVSPSTAVPPTENENPELTINNKESATEVSPPTDKSTFSSNEIMQIIKSKLKNQNLSNEQAVTINKKVEETVRKLKQYKITGVGICYDANGCFIYDPQNPVFDLSFKNKNGRIKERTYQFKIKSIGLKLGFAINFNIIFFINTNLNLHSANKKIEFSWGFSTGAILSVIMNKTLGMPIQLGTDIHVLKLKKMPGSAIMLTAALGFLGYGPAIVTDGYMKPIKEYDDDDDDDDYFFEA